MHALVEMDEAEFGVRKRRSAGTLAAGGTFGNIVDKIRCFPSMDAGLRSPRIEAEKGPTTAEAKPPICSQIPLRNIRSL